MWLGLIVASGFFPVMLARPALLSKFVSVGDALAQPRKSFILDFILCISAGICISFFNRIAFGIPVLNLLSLIIGCVISGFFIGLDSALFQERQVILHAMTRKTPATLPKKYWPMTNRFTFVAITAFLFVAIVLILVFVRDIDWLANHVQEEGSVQAAMLSVTYEVIFIITILAILIVNLIFSYSRNLRLLFNNETKILEQVSRGDLSAKVSVATHDEFGVIAGHTNNMIDGLRHRFELISSLKLAEGVQQNLLPAHSPYLDGFDISGTSLYCDQTGGDYYDYFLLEHNKLGLVVADACGHGVDAAILMTSVRAFLTSAIEQYKSPASLIQKINRYITRDCAKTGRFTTMFFLELDHLQQEIRWVRAGHEPALVYHGSKNSFSQLNGAGLVLGIDDNFQYEEYYQDTTSLDIILIGTDGISETRNKTGEMFGTKRIEEIIQQNSLLSAKEIQEIIVRAVTSFRGDLPQEDDITLVIIKVL